MYITRAIVNKTIVALVDFLDNDFIQVLKGDEFYVVSVDKDGSLCNCNGHRFWIQNWELGLAFKKNEVTFKQKATYKMDITHCQPSFESKSEAPMDGTAWREFMHRPRKQGGLGIK